MIQLGVLDQSPIRASGTAAETWRETIELVQAAERAGYHRYWLAKPTRLGQPDGWHE
jgi:alkanesulfonate monooxygenase SsuD/methylene tetrahydromethanopterin reductase-like flavin-dependent oxidoreductase (luciferase family)